MRDAVNCSYTGHGMAKFNILGGIQKIRPRTLENTLQSVKRTGRKIPREAALKGKGTQKNLVLLIDNFPKVQE